jgi:photosystem II stability/assembly factor-like uncharacterized protein
MSTTVQSELAQKLPIPPSLSRILTGIALPAAIALFAYDFYLYKLTHPTIVPSPGPAAYIPLPITGWQALALQAGPFALIALALISVTLDIIGRWQTRKRQTQQESSIPLLAAARPKPVWKDNRWGLSTWLALSPLVLALLAPTPAPWLFDTGGETILDSVAMTSPDEGWAVGGFLKNAGGDFGIIWHYQNGKWTPISIPPSARLLVAAALPDGEAWAVGEGGTILHERGGKWTQVESGTTDDLYSVAMISPTEGWAVGGDQLVAIAPASNGAVSSEAAHALFSSQNLVPNLAARPGDDITCIILHYINGQWRPVSCPTSTPLRSVFALPDGEAWVVGGGTILHEQDGTWTGMHGLNSGLLQSIAMASPTEGWAVGYEGTLLHYHNGSWTLEPALTSEPLHSVALVSAEEGWIVGDYGTILHESKGTWTRAFNPTDDTFFDVTLLPGGQEGWAVRPPILHEQNGRWSVYP